MLAVVPLLAFTDGKPERLLADSLAEDVAVELSKFAWFEVIDCVATCRAPQCDCSPLEAASRLHADYALTGTVRRLGSENRITVQLLSSCEGTTVWADQFDLAFDPPRLTGHDAVALRIVQTVGDMLGALGQALLSGVRRKPIGELTALETPADRVSGTVAACLAARRGGATIFRVHDVAAAVSALKVADAIERAAPPGDCRRRGRDAGR